MESKKSKFQLELRIFSRRKINSTRKH